MGYYSEMEVFQNGRLSEKFEKIFNEISNLEKLKFSEETGKIYKKFKTKAVELNEWDNRNFLDNYIVEDGMLKNRDGYEWAKNYADRLLCILLIIIAKHTGDKLDIELRFRGEDGEIWGYQVGNNIMKEFEYELKEIQNQEVKI